MMKMLGAAVAAVVLSCAGAASALTYVDTAPVYYAEGREGYALIDRYFHWDANSIYLQTGTTYQVSIKLSAGSFDLIELQFYDMLKVGRIQLGEFYTDYLDI